MLACSHAPSTMTAENAQQSSRPKRPSFAIRAARKLWRLAVDAPFRHMTLLHLMRPAGAFQPFNDTKPNRYPAVFKFVQSELGADSEIRILSFGCSTGEEVFSLRGYFPRAVIKGIDLNAGNIAVCRRRAKTVGDPDISFETASSTSAEAAASYDAIFAMAVLRHGSLGLPGVNRCDHLIRFEDFAPAVEDLARCLKPGGLLAIAHSNFRLCDAPVGASFETALRVGRAQSNNKIPLFGPDNRLIEGATYPDTVFRRKMEVT